MRDIIFRGIGIKSREWVYGAYVPAMDEDDCDSIIDEQGEHHIVFSDTVGQYTGLQDKNGKKIFEGDILAFVGAENPKAFFVIVEWDARLCCYYLRRVDVNICNRYGFFPSSYTLEGNIHDHKHLIK